MTSRQQFLGNAGNVHMEQKKGTHPMSESLWCDIDDNETNALHQIGHSFSAKDPDRKHFAQTSMIDVPTGNSYGSPTYQTREQITDELDMCGYHWRKSSPFHAKRAEIPPTNTNQATLEELEVEDADYRRGYQAAQDEFYGPMK